MIQDPAIARVTEDLLAPAFRAGEVAERWRVVARAFPVLLVEVAATEPDCRSSWYRFRVDVSGYPGKPPWVRIWDTTADQPLPLHLRPTGCHRVSVTFQNWANDTVYRPWERMAADHNNFRLVHPQLAWHPGRTLAFIFEDLHGILNLNARACGVRSAA